MIEIIAITCGIIGGLASLGTTGYKCYKTYHNRTKSTEVKNESKIKTCHHLDHREGVLEDIISNEFKKRKSGDSDTSMDIKINIHTYEGDKK